MAVNRENQKSFSEQFYESSYWLNEALKQPTPELQTFYGIYRPLDYAAQIYRNFLQKYLNGPKRILFVGMNPSRYGSLLTGIPFGDITTVRDRMQLDVSSLDSMEIGEEQSSQRFWNLIKSIFNDEQDFIDRFFQNCFVHNVCPLVFINNNGHNVSFQSLAERMTMETRQIEVICRSYLELQVQLLQPEIIIAVGWYAFNMLRSLDYYKNGRCIVEKIPHPSPKNFDSELDWINVCKPMLINNHRFSEIIQSQANENQASNQT
ncbi:single-strand selective monofunctional uracil-DNA glycosylase-like [Musca autumnalis]|uniref:single-strand selective monofunctional uracil-DNA glycosylase-like n=1 Tax=Musca autumnalis TaxID=221902 RepID=UPI003CF641D1